MPKLAIIINSTESEKLLNRGHGWNKNSFMQNMKNIAIMMNGLANGAFRFSDARVIVNEGFASGTVTFTGAPTAAETLAINGVTFTARASGAVANEFNIGASVTETAANLAAAINASVTAKIKGIVSATSSAGVVTVAFLSPGEVGLLGTITESLTNATAATFALATADSTYEI